MIDKIEEGHYHIAGTEEEPSTPENIDTCKKCGKDIRDSIHFSTPTINNL